MRKKRSSGYLTTGIEEEGELAVRVDQEGRRGDGLCTREEEEELRRA